MKRWRGDRSMHSSRAQSNRDQSTKNLDSRREGRERGKKIENSLTKLPVHRSEMPRKGGVC